MPRFRDTMTGSIVNVSEETAARLPSHYVPLDKAKVEPKPRRGRPRKTEE